MRTDVIVFLPLSQGQVAIIDFDDIEKVRGVKWHLRIDGHQRYAARMVCVNGKRGVVRLHQALLPGAVSVDHRDGNGLNNRRKNLREATKSQNGQAHQVKRAGASSKYRGVSFFKRDQNWSAQIDVGGRKRHLGYFSKEEDAARAYDFSARLIYREFASPNFPV